MTAPAPLDPGCSVGLVGVGRMGRPMAARIAAGGYPLQVADADAGAARLTAAESGPTSRAVELPALGPGLDALILMLPNGHAVRSVLLDQGLMQRLPRGCVVIDMGSSDPAGTAELGALAEALGLQMVDAPVSGGVPRASNGTLTIMAGGNAQAVARCKPLLGTMGNRIFSTGALGSGQAMKSLNNFVSAVGLVATCEAVLIARRFGLDPQVAAEVLDGSTGKNNTTEHKLRQFILSGSYASGFALDLMVKDLAIAASVAQQTHTPTVLADRCLELWRQAQAALGPGRDHTEMARWLETAMQSAES